MPEHPNIETLREGYALFNKGEMETAMESWSDDIVWHTPGNSPIAGDYRGKQEIAGFFAKMQGMGLTSMNLEVHDILANDEHAMAMIDINVDRGDHHYEASPCTSGTSGTARPRSSGAWRRIRRRRTPSGCSRIPATKQRAHAIWLERDPCDQIDALNA